jgi:hypothetical protein
MNRERLLGLCAALALSTGATVFAASQHSMRVTLDAPAAVKGAALQAGEYKISWTTDGDKADVTFTQKGKVVAQAQAKVVEKDHSAIDDEVIFTKDAGGARTLAKLRPRGEKAEVVLPIS